jgi:hypothetical protein
MECANQLGDHIKTDGGHKHLENSAIPAFQKDLADLQKHDNKRHDQEFAAGRAATEELVSAGMIPSLKIENRQALFVAGATQDKQDLVISVGRESDPHHTAVVMDADGVYWKSKSDGHGHYSRDENGRIGNAEQFKAWADKQLGQTTEGPQPLHKPGAPEPSNFESKANYDKFLENMGHVYNKYDLNVLADCYKHMNRMDQVRILSELQTYNNSHAYALNSDNINIEPSQSHDGTIVVSASNHERTISSDPH